LGGRQDPQFDVATTHEAGIFSFAYIAQGGRGAGEEEAEPLLFRVVAPNGTTVPGSFERVPEMAEAFDLAVPAPAGPQPPVLEDVAARVNLTLPPDLLAALAQRGIDSLPELHRAGGLDTLVGQL
jgi:hypothetical protein